MAKINPRSLRLKRTRVKNGTKAGTTMNKLLFTTTWLNNLQTPTKRLRFYDLKINGLLVEKMTSGSTIFRFRKETDGKEQWATIGPYPQVSLEEARDSAISLAAELIAGDRFNNKHELTLKELSTLYFDQYAEGRCITVGEMRKDFERYWFPIHMQKTSQIDTYCIQVGVNKIGARGTYGVANKALRLLSAIFGWGVKQKLVKLNPAIGVTKFKESPRIRFVQPHEFTPLLNAIKAYPDERIRDFFLICLYTGARSGNVKAMRWEQIDIKGGYWTIPRTKNGDSQTIALPCAAMDILIYRVNKRELNPWVFPSGRHGVQTGHLSTAKKAWTKICKQACIQDLRIHDLRRTLAVSMLSTGASTAMVRDQLAHKSLQSAQIYQKVIPKATKEAADKAVGWMHAN